MPCDSPYYVLPYKGAFDKVPVPCGKCPVCKTRRVNQWVFRLMQQEKVSTSAHFVTLTYDTRTVPITPNGFMTLRKKDLQDFWKRLRKLCPDVKIKYYVAGEYGTQNKRPHYHAIVFNVPDSEMFNKAWGLGTIHVGQVSSDSVAYTMKYIDKPNFSKMHKRDDRASEFALMSKGLGANYLTDNARRYHTQNIGNLYVTKLSGHKVPMPRYYRNKLFSEQEKEQQIGIVQAAIQKREIERRKELRGGPLTYEQVIESERQARYTKFYNSLNSHNRKL